MKEINLKFYRKKKWKKVPEVVVPCAQLVKGIRTFILVGEEKQAR